MKSSSLSHSANAVDYKLLERSAFEMNPRKAGLKITGRRRASRKNLLVFTLVYGVCLTLLLMYML